MELIETYNSIKDNKLKRPKVKDFDKVIIDSKGTTFGQFKELTETKIQNLELRLAKLQDEVTSSNSKTTDSIAKIIDSQSILLKKITEVENSLNTALSMIKK